MQRKVRSKKHIFYLCLFIVFVGFFHRTYIGVITDNADARTLTWGSMHLAQGHIDPYEETIDKAQGDAIPLDSIRSLSLAQGPLGVVTGASTLFIGEKLDLIDFPKDNSARSFGAGEILAYKLSYVFPELIILACIIFLFSKKGNLTLILGLLIWAISPLTFYTWGQGLPDAWTIAIFMTSIVLVAKLKNCSKHKRYILILLSILLLSTAGALLTKLVPIILALPAIAIIASDKKTSYKEKTAIFSIATGIVTLCTLPYIFSDYLATSVGVRFEFAMLFSKSGLPTGSALPDAHIMLAVLIFVAIAYLYRRKFVTDYNYFVALSTLIIATSAGTITHLMCWALIGIYLVLLENKNIAIFLSGTLGLSVVWYIFAYSWVSDIITRSFKFNHPIGSAYDYVSFKIGFTEMAGKLISSGILLACVLVALMYFTKVSKKKSIFNRDFSNRIYASSICAVFLIYLAFMFATPILGAKDGGNVWDFSYKRPANTSIEIKRGTKYSTTAVTKIGKVNQVKFQVHQSSQPSKDQIRFDIVNESSKTLASGSVPIYVAEPYSDRGYVTIKFPKKIDINKAHVEIQIVDSKGKKFQQYSNSDSYFALNASYDDNGVKIPNIRLSEDASYELFSQLFKHFFDYKKILGTVMLSFTLTLLFVIIADLPKKMGLTTKELLALGR